MATQAEAERLQVEHAVRKALPKDAERLLGVTSSVYGSAVREGMLRQQEHGLGVATTERHDPAKMFTRAEVCAVIRGQMAITHDSHLRDLLTIFERMK